MEIGVLSYCRLWGWDGVRVAWKSKFPIILRESGDVIDISSPPSSLCLFCLFYKALASVLKRALQSHSLVG